MEETRVVEVLRALATGDKHRSETARLRDILDEVEATLRAGVRRAAILEALHAQGFTMTLKSFESALYRIRKQRARAGRPSASPPSLRDDEGAEPNARHAPLPDDLAGLDKQQRRERLADQFIRPETTNPLLRRLSKEKKP